MQSGRLVCSVWFSVGLALAGPQAAQAQGADDWAVTRDPFDQRVVAQYKAGLRRNPHDATLLRKLSELYRRYRSDKQLIQEFTALAAAGDGAAHVVLARLALRANQTALAQTHVRDALRLRPTDAATAELAGDAVRDTEPATAQQYYERALALSAAPAAKRRLGGLLAELASRQHQPTQAAAYLKAIALAYPRDPAAQLAWADAELARNAFQAAVEGYERAEAGLAANPHKRLAAMAKRGQALEAWGKPDAAIALYERAIALAPRGYYLEHELTDRIVNMYRQRQDLASLVRSYETRWPANKRGFHEWQTLGKLYEETGAQAQAIDAFKHAAHRAPWELDVQRRLIHLLTFAGRDTEALAQLEAVAKAAPGDARLQFELASKHWAQGAKAQALARVAKTTRATQDIGVLLAAADLYTRWGDEPKALELYGRLIQLEPGDPNHIIALGELHHNRGDKTKAIAVWQALAQPKSAHGLAKYGEVLAGHGYTKEAMTQYEAALALDGNTAEVYRLRAHIYDLEKRYALAVVDWQHAFTLFQTQGAPRSKLRELQRKHVASVIKWGAPQRIRDGWRKAFMATPPDLNAGFLLAELYSKVPVADEPRQTLERLRQLAPDDEDLLLELARAYRTDRQFDRAVAALLDLAKLAPPREREAYSLIAEIKAEARDDEAALAWAQKALDKNPNDPSGYAKLAQRHLDRNDLAAATTALAKAIELDGTNFETTFALAELYQRERNFPKAIELYRRLLKLANDDDQLARVAHAALDLEELQGSLGELERYLAPLAFVMSHRPAYKAQLTELYVRYVPTLYLRATQGDGESQAAAQRELTRIGTHSLQPLLEAMHAAGPGLRRIQLAHVLGLLGNGNATGPLLRLAQDAAPPGARQPTSGFQLDRQTRQASLWALSRLPRQAKLAAALVPLFRHADASLADLAVWASTQHADLALLPTYAALLAASRWQAQALACYGLGKLGSQLAGQHAVHALLHGNLAPAAQGACAWTVGRLKVPGAEPTLRALARGSDLSGHLATWALRQFGNNVGEIEMVRHYYVRGLPTTSGLLASPLDVGIPAGELDVETMLQSLPLSDGAPHVPAEASVIEGIKRALQGTRDDRLATLVMLDAEAAGLGLPSTASAHAGSPTLLAAVEAMLVGLTPADEAELAIQLSLVGKLATTPAARQRLLAALVPEAPVQRQSAGLRAAAAWLRRSPDAELIRQTLGYASSQRWQHRALAIAALATRPELQATLAGFAADTSSLVRHALVESTNVTTPGAAALLLSLAGDSAGIVRAAVAAKLASITSPAAVQARARLAQDPDPAVRNAATK